MNSFHGVITLRVKPTKKRSIISQISSTVAPSVIQALNALRKAISPCFPLPSIAQSYR